jgi:hypothetical protein
MEPVSAEPSWGRVLTTTITLWVRRRHAVGFTPRTPGQPRRSWFGEPSGRLRRLGAWRLVALLVILAVVGAAATEFADAAFQGTRAAYAGYPGPRGAHGTSSQEQAAAWIANQVSSDTVIACYPAMCTVLQEQGVAADRLMPLQPGSVGPIDASVIVTSPSTASQVTDAYAPALIASFGSGLTRVEVRAAEPGGAAAYESAFQADRTARKYAGSELLRNWRIQFTTRDAAQLRAGEVDSRLLATLAALASQYSFRVTSFGDTSPGVQVLFREATIASGGKREAAGLAGAAALLNGQDPPFLPTHVTIGHPGAGQVALSIEFAAPSPLGLLTPTVEVHQQRTAPATVIANALPLGWARPS